MHSQAPKCKTKTKWPIIVLPLSNQKHVEQQKKHAKDQNTLKVKSSWLNVWQKWASK